MLDLHIHSNASDGILSPTALVKRAVEVGLSGISLTDHDTTAGSLEACVVGHRLGLRVMSGVEISTEWNSSDVHILGYFIDDHGPLQQLIEKARLAREQRMAKILAKLLDLNMDVRDEVRGIQRTANDALGRPHVARALVAKGYAASVEDAFNRLLERGRPAYVPRFRIDPHQAVSAIRASSGVAVWAHPGVLGSTLIGELAAAGLAGLEVYHPLHTDQMQTELIMLGRRYGLILTGGSDAHDAASVGSVTVDDQVWQEIEARRA